MKPPLPKNLGQAYGTVVGELGLVGSAWLFVEEVARQAGDEGVLALSEALAPTYPVVDAVARLWLDGARAPSIDAAAVLDALEGAEQLVVVGFESLHLDALVRAAPPALAVSLLSHRPFPVDWDRVVANYGGRVELRHLDNFQSAAGPRSALLGFMYGVSGDRAHVPPLWARVLGADVRAQFRSLIGWDALGAPMHLYPRWLTEVSTEEFTHVVGVR